MINIVGFTGSLRKESYNLATLKNIKDLVPKNVNFEILDISSFPFLNEDTEDNVPNMVQIFKERIKQADGVIIATPEYNYSLPPVLKNALDWSSRDEINCFQNKPVAIISASPSILGGVRAQLHLREVLLCLGTNTIIDPEIFIMKAHEKFDAKGKLIDNYTKQLINELVDVLLEKIGDKNA